MYSSPFSEKKKYLGNKQQASLKTYFYSQNTTNSKRISVHKQQSQIQDGNWNSNRLKEDKNNNETNSVRKKRHCRFFKRIYRHILIEVNTEYYQLTLKH